MKKPISTTYDSWKEFLDISVNEFKQYILDNDSVTVLLNWNPYKCFSDEYLYFHPEFTHNFSNDPIENEPFAMSVIESSDWGDYEIIPKALIPFIDCEYENNQYYFSHKSMNISLKSFAIKVTKEMLNKNFHRDDISNVLEWINTLIIYKKDYDSAWIITTHDEYSKLSFVQDNIKKDQLYKDTEKFEKQKQQFYAEKMHFDEHKYVRIGYVFLFIVCTYSAISFIFKT